MLQGSGLFRYGMDEEDGDGDDEEEDEESDVEEVGDSELGSSVCNAAWKSQR